MENNKQDNNSSQRSNEEEIDLGQLFTLIGKGFSNLFSFIGGIFTAIFNVLIDFILIVKKNLVNIVLGVVIGTASGYIYKHYFKIPTYESSMTVQPNFGSTIQLYKNIDYYQNLVRQKDFERLATSLNISLEESKNISGFEVKPYRNANETLLAFKRFTSGLDSTTINKIEFEDFIENQPAESFKFHIVTVVSKDKYIFGKLRSPIISSIIRNTYYDQVRTTSHSNLLSRKKAIQESMAELDTLRSLYKEVILAESKKEVNGTNIYMSSTSSDNKEVVVFDKFMKMNESLIDVNIQLTEENEIINVVSSFNPVGMRQGGILRNYTILGGALGFILVFLILIVVHLNKQLINYENKMKS